MEEIRARLDAVTSLPWKLEDGNGNGVDIRGAGRRVGRDEWEDSWITVGDDGGGAFSDPANAGLCANAPADLEFLLTANDALCRRIEGYQALIALHIHDNQKLAEERDALRSGLHDAEERSEKPGDITVRAFGPGVYERDRIRLPTDDSARVVAIRRRDVDWLIEVLLDYGRDEGRAGPPSSPGAPK